MGTIPGSLAVIRSYIHYLFLILLQYSYEQAVLTEPEEHPWPETVSRSKFIGSNVKFVVQKYDEGACGHVLLIRGSEEFSFLGIRLLSAID
jgi:hypothetical protein